MGTRIESGSIEMPTLLGLINGYRITQAIHAAVHLGIPELLVNGPRSSAELAASTLTHAPSMERLLRALAAVGILNEGANAMFALTALGRGLEPTANASLNAWAKLVGSRALWSAWGELIHTVRTGETAFDHVHGRNVWDARQMDPEDGALFALAMREGSAKVAADVLSAWNFSQCRHIIDVGGGDGSLLNQLLVALPEARGTLLDLRYAIEHRDPRCVSHKLADRLDVVAGDFLTDVPVGADVYLLKHVLHDWGNREALGILRACRLAMAAHSRLLVIERLLAPPNEGIEGKLSDLNMMVVTGGRERTREEFSELLADAGLRIESQRLLPSGRTVLVAICLASPIRGRANEHDDNGGASSKWPTKVSHTRHEHLRSGAQRSVLECRHEDRTSPGRQFYRQHCDELSQGAELESRCRDRGDKWTASKQAVAKAQRVAEDIDRRHLDADRAESFK